MRAATPPDSNTDQQGFSLIELMIAITIGLVIIAAIGYMFQTSKVSYNTSQGVARLQENARSAQLLLNTAVREGGYIDDPVTYSDPSTVFSSTYGYRAFLGGLPSAVHSQFSWVTAPSYSTSSVDETGLSINNDYLEIAFVGSSSTSLVMTNCLGTQITGSQISVNVFYVDQQPTDSIPSLYCATQTYSVTAPTTVVTAVQTQPIIAGIRGLQVKYGLDANWDFATDYYATNAAVTNWTKLRSMQIRLTAMSNDMALAAASSALAVTTSSAITYGSQTNNTQTVYKGYLTRPIISTLFVRNRLALYTP